MQVIADTAVPISKLTCQVVSLIDEVTAPYLISCYWLNPGLLYNNHLTLARPPGDLAHLI